MVCNQDGKVGIAWKPGGNFMLSMPDGGNSSVKIKDAWDDAYREVQIETTKTDRARRGRRGKVGPSVLAPCRPPASIKDQESPPDPIFMRLFALFRCRMLGDLTTRPTRRCLVLPAMLWSGWKLL